MTVGLGFSPSVGCWCYEGQAGHVREHSSIKCVGSQRRHSDNSHMVESIYTMYQNMNISASNIEIVDVTC